MSDYIASINTDKPVLKYITLGGGLYMNEETGNCYRFDGTGQGWRIHESLLRKCCFYEQGSTWMDIPKDKWQKSSLTYDDCEFS